MPFKSEAQRRKFHAMADRGEMSPETVKKWEDHTPEGKLPEKVEKKASISSHLTMLGMGGGLGAAGVGYFGHKYLKQREGEAKQEGFQLGHLLGAHGVTQEEMGKSAFERGFEKAASITPETIWAHKKELLGLGALAIPSAMRIGAAITGNKSLRPSENFSDVTDVAGLGILAGPYAKSLLTKMPIPH